MANLKDIKDVPVIESLTGEEKVLLNVNGSAKQVSVKDLKDTSKSPVIKSLADEALVLVNVDGELKQVPANLIKNPTRELFREWNFSVNDEVHELEENISEDISWLTTKTDNIYWEIVAETYGYNVVQDEIDDSATSTIVIDCNDTYNCYATGVCGADSVLRNLTEGTRIEADEGIFVMSILGINVASGIDIDMNAVDNGGSIFVLSPELPLKSLKIYKIIH